MQGWFRPHPPQGRTISLPVLMRTNQHAPVRRGGHGGVCFWTLRQLNNSGDCAECSMRRLHSTATRCSPRTCRAGRWEPSMGPVFTAPSCGRPDDSACGISCCWMGITWGMPSPLMVSGGRLRTWESSEDPMVSQRDWWQCHVTDWNGERFWMDRCSGPMTSIHPPRRFMECRFLPGRVCILACRGCTRLSTIATVSTRSINCTMLSGIRHGPLTCSWRGAGIRSAGIVRLNDSL